MTRHRWPVPAMLFAGSLLLQLAWIVALPPFRGIDEFDHAYRAAEVAHGEWISSYTQPEHGRGDLVTVPRSLVAAAAPECETYSYVGHDNCHPAKTLGDGMVSVASAAARYNPFFYWIVGLPAIPFSGATALYVMRCMAAVLCSAMVALTGAALQRWRRPQFALAALFVAMTPMAIYSTALPAPNGIEMVAGLAIWACLLSITDSDCRIHGTLLWLAVPPAMVLGTVRSIGPLWLMLIVVTCIGVLGWRQVGELIRHHRRTAASATALILLVTLAGAAWTLTQGTNAPSSEVSTTAHPHPVLNSLKLLPLWLLQTMGAFPTRNERAPAILYAVFLLTFVLAAFVALRYGGVRLRLGFLAACVCGYGVPLILSFLTYSQQGGAWQGRYALPYTIGIPLIAALGLARRPVQHRLSGPFLLGGWCAVAVAQAAGVIAVLIMERASSPLSGSNEWHAPPLWLVIALTTIGLATWAIATHQANRSITRWQETTVPDQDKPSPAADPKAHPVACQAHQQVDEIGRKAHA